MQFEMQIILGDIHFGRYNNSPNWLENQVLFIKHQVYEGVRKYQKQLDSIIFLGDIFENRNSINVMVGVAVKELFKDILKTIPDGCKVYILAGNHDFYSPIEEQSDINAYELVFGEEFLECHDNFKIAVNVPYRINNHIALFPWYCTENQDRFIKYIEEFSNVDVIYCHTDVTQFSEEVISTLNKYNINVYSGHIHIPSVQHINTSTTLWQMGACLPLDFNDVNSSRYFYVMDGDKLVEKIENRTTLQFRRYYNESIFSLTEDSFKNATTELCINKDLINTAKYIEQINYLRTTFVDYKIEVRPIDVDVVYENDESLSIVTNIGEYIEKNIPEHLQDKYKYVKTKICS